MQKEMLKHQKLANMQQEASDCLANQMNLYLDTVSALTSRYGLCKAKCLETNIELRKELADQETDREHGQRSKYFDPMTSDPCLSGCRA